jgi:hypothetical protein
MAEEPTSAESQVQHEESDFGKDFDEAFSELEGSEPEDQEPEEETDEPEQRDVDDTLPGRETLVAEGAAEEPEEERDEESKEPDERYEKALLALRYSGVPSSIIKNASRDELIAWGTQAAERRAKTEAALEERAKRIRELEDGAKAPAESAKPAAVDWSPHLKALAETLGLDPEAAKQAFVPVLDAVAQQVRTEFDGRFSKHEQTIQETRAAEGRRQISEQVRRLAGTFPKLRTDQGLIEKLNAKALALWKTGQYETAEAVYDDASRLVDLGHTTAISGKRRNGSAPPPEGRVEDRTENSEDAFMRALERVEAGDARGARRFGSQVTWGPGGRRQRTRE